MAGLSERTEGEPSPIFEATVIGTERSIEGAELIADQILAGDLPEVTELEEVSVEPQSDPEGE